MNQMSQTRGTLNQEVAPEDVEAGDAKMKPQGLEAGTDKEMRRCVEAANDPVMQEDLEAIVFGDLPFAGLCHATVLVTGATGLIGSQMVRLLACYNRIRDLDIRILAFARNQEKAQRIFGDLLSRGDVDLVLGDVNEKIQIDGDIDYIIHGASATSSKYFVSHPVETIATALDGTRNILELAREKQVSSMVYLSSLEVYGTVPPLHGPVKEEDYGYLDPLSARSSYSEGKRMAECLCAAYAQEYQVPVKIARLSQTFGAGVEYQDGRVFAEFARCVAEKKDIVLRTAGNTVRTYCYTKDALEALLYILLMGKAKEAYNVTNMDTAISIKDMAQLVCDTFPEAGIQVRIEIPQDLSQYGYNPEMVIRLDSSKLEGLGWRATTGLAEMFRRMAQSGFSVS